jgi:ankyrin repeat protein
VCLGHDRYLASQRGHFPVVEVLLKAGANPTAKARDGRTPADVVCEKADETLTECAQDIRDLILQAKAKW